MIDCRNRFVRLICILIVSVTFNCAGCEAKKRTAGPVDPLVARAALKTTLDAWMDGKSPAALRKRQPTIVAQDADWLSGMRLAQYKLLDPGTERDANLECQVKLWMIDSKGKVAKRTVTYVIGTDPVLTVFRKVKM